MEPKRHLQPLGAREARLLHLAKESEAEGKWLQAIAVCRKILNTRPDAVGVHIEIGNILHRHGQFKEAIAEYELALRSHPRNHDALYNLGNAKADSGNLQGAIECYRKAISTNPNSSLAWKELGVSLQQLGSIAEANRAYERALELDPKFAAAHANRGNLFARQGLISKAIESYRTALALDPSLHQIHSNLLFFINFDPNFDKETIFNEYLAWNKRYAKPLVPSVKPSHTDHRPLKIGYVSPDFRDHVIGSYMETILKNLDRSLFDIFIYSDVLQADETTEALKQLHVAWRDCISLSHEQLANKILDDQIDILVDLSGHMNGNRLLTFARKPAPVQITQLGYPSTTGLDTMDARITDACMDPVGMTESTHTEKLYRLPHCAFCYTPLPNSPDTAPPPCGKNGYITFGSFNNFAKVSDAAIALWKQILDTLPTSRLLILIQGGENNRSIVEERFSKFAIAGNRLKLEPLRSRRDYLELHHQIDIHLDTLPYNGGITTFEALWMGVPVITFEGQNQVSRHGVSILHNLGIPGWIAHTEAEYVQIAQKLATSPGQLSEYRNELRSKMLAAPFMDGSLYAQELASAYLEVWQDCIAGCA